MEWDVSNKKDVQLSSRKRKPTSVQDILLNDIYSNETFDILSAGSLKDENYLYQFEGLEDIKKYKIIKFPFDCTLENIKKTIDCLNCEVYLNLFVFIIDVANAGLKVAENTPKKAKSDSLVDEIKNEIFKFGKERPIILQLTSVNENLTRFCYKDAGPSELKEIVDVQEIISESIDFPFILNEFLYNGINSAVELASKFFQSISNSTLILRLFMIFELNESNWNKLILKCAEYGSVDDLMAVLDEPFSSEKRIISINSQFLHQTFFEYHFESDEKSSEDARNSSVYNTEEKSLYTSVLFKAINQKNKNVTDYLINYCTYIIKLLPFDQKVKISTIAFNTQQFKILCILIDKTDFPFPRNIRADEIENENLREIVEKRKNLKAAIKANDTDKILKFIENNSSIKIGYNIKNQSAMKVALYKSKFKAFYFLKSHGFTQPKFDNSSERIHYQKQLQNAEKFKLKQRENNVNDCIYNNSKTVNVLFNKSVIFNIKGCKGDEVIYWTKIREWLENIYKIAECKLMLDIAASCNELKLIFDFENFTVRKIHKLPSSLK